MKLISYKKTIAYRFTCDPFVETSYTRIQIHASLNHRQVKKAERVM